MNDVIFSTRGTGKALKILLVSSAILILIAIFIKVQVGDTNMLAYRMSDDYKTAVWVMSLFMISILFCEIALLVFSFKLFTVYVDVYRDRFVGKGLPNIKSMLVNSHTFNLKNEQICNISAVNSLCGSTLCIHTNNGEYNIYTDKKTANAILNYFAELKS